MSLVRRVRSRSVAAWLALAMLAAGCSGAGPAAVDSTAPGSTTPTSAGPVTSGSADTGSGDGATERYDFGEPSVEEQQLWFLANRARADPAAEGRRLAAPDDALVKDGLTAFGVDVEQLVADFAGYPVRPPVVWDAALSAAAARHATDQAAERTQAHRGSDGSKPAARVRAAGVAFSVLHENISGYAHSPQFAHDAFAIDWGGPAPTGVQEWPTPGHRFALMSAGVAAPTNAVGMSWVGVASGDDNYGPFVVVQEFARIDGTFVVGTVWADANGDEQFQWGEGVADAEVRVDGGRWLAVTLSGGGYELPLDAGTHTLTFRAPDGRSTQQTVQVGTENVLVNAELTASGG